MQDRCHVVRDGAELGADDDAHEYGEDAYAGEALRDAFGAVEELAVEFGIAPAALEEAKRLLSPWFDEEPRDTSVEPAPQMVELDKGDAGRLLAGDVQVVIAGAARRLLASGVEEVVQGELEEDGSWDGFIRWGRSPQDAVFESSLVYGLGVSFPLAPPTTRPRWMPRSRRSRSTRRARITRRARARSPGRSSDDDEPAPPSRRLADASRRSETAAERRRRDGNRLWGAAMLALELDTCRSILAGRRVLAGRLDGEVLRRALRGEPLPAWDSFLEISDGMLDSVAEAGAFPTAVARRAA